MKLRKTLALTAATVCMFSALAFPANAETPDTAPKTHLAEGLKNGLTQGTKNGLVDGLKNGLVNGLVEGLKSGLINGNKK